jgi:hypothetical protein
VSVEFVYAILGVEPVCWESNPYHSKGEPGLVEKDIRSSGSDDLQPGKKEVFTISDQPRGKTKKSSLLHLTSTE